ncbi:MAG: heparan-alpha-glucosaminide N-acetyltransferase domain-containing protein [Candidatus Solibacter sp.]
MAAPSSSQRPGARIASVDALRGLVMIIMALDHVRDYYHRGATTFQPDDISRTTAVLFFTRWITHFCAPVFMFTAGLGAYLWLRPGRTTADLSHFLWKRGLWLVFLELTALRLVMSFGLLDGPVFLTVLWALGWSMFLLGFLVRMPIRLLTVFSLAVIVLHNLADPIRAASFGSYAWVWNILHQAGFIQAGPVPVIAAYPLVPWFAVMAAGYCFGPVLSLEPARRRRWMVRLGAALTLTFIVLRAINVYGDPARWTTRFPGMTLLSFLRVTKYPPSLDFLLVTLGPALLMLAFFDRREFRSSNPLMVYGKVPLFYFLAHFALLHVLLFPLTYLRYGRADFLWHALTLGADAKTYPPDFGYPLWFVYVVWAAVVIALYPVCLWFSRLKQRRRDWWLSYL